VRIDSEDLIGSSTVVRVLVTFPLDARESIIFEYSQLLLVADGERIPSTSASTHASFINICLIKMTVRRKMVNSMSSISS
jgi:hypothetical protein